MFFAGCLEMQDFIVFAFLAPVIHKNYLSFLDESTGLIITYTLFAAGFLFRPLGSIIFGHIGDKYGRKKALVISVTLPSTASVSLSLLSKYEDIGIISCFFNSPNKSRSRRIGRRRIQRSRDIRRNYTLNMFFNYGTYR